MSNAGMRSKSGFAILLLALSAVAAACGDKAGTGGSGGNGGAAGAGGTSGLAGASGAAGASGVSGAAGSAGATGGTGGGIATAGTTGSAGTIGVAGAAGASGAAGAAGASGAAGAGGAPGTAGTTGPAGRGGSSGSTGAAGRGDTTGSGGSTSGAAGAAANLGSWELLAPMPGGARQEFNVGAVKGIVYAVGAFGTAADSKRLEAYDPATNAWTTKASIPFSSDHPNVGATADKLYILGEVGAQNTAEYDPATNTWTMKAPIPTQRAASATAAIGTKIYVAGGAMGSNGASFGPTVRDFAVYDTVANTWETLDPIPSPGRNHAVGAAVNGIFYIIGGRTNGPTDGLQNRVDAYDPATKQWTQKANMPVARGGCMGGVVNGQIVVVGGEGNARDINPNGVFPDTDVYDPVADMWRVMAPMRTPRHGTGAAGVGNKLYVPGGATAQGGGTAVAILEALTLP
jgi:N-acetylneuraminic acid mutarotase